MKLLTASLLIFIAINLQADCSLSAETFRDLYEKEKALVFSTWEGFEVDKCASIWLIKRFIDKNAKIKFFPKGALIKEGIPFDTPEAKLRRYYNMSAFESILKHYNIKDPILNYIGKIIHDIEVNIWERKVLKETLIVQDEVRKIITKYKNNNEIIEESCNYFDTLYQKITLF